jgi:hypothetical protein
VSFNFIPKCSDPELEAKLKRPNRLTAGRTVATGC